MAGFSIVLAVHGVLLYNLWHHKVLPPPAEAATLFVNLLQDKPPEPKPLKPPPPKSQPVKLEKPVEPPPPQQLVAQAPVRSPAEPVAPPPPPVPQRVIEAPLAPVLPPPPPAPPKPVGPVTLSGDLAIACPERVPPAYPSLSRRLGEEGKTVLKVELNESGAVDRATIKISSGYARLDDAALTAVKRWRCNPATRDGEAVRAIAIQPFNFVLEGR